MTLYELRSDVELLAQMLKLSKDSRLHTSHIDFMINKHRARGIREEFARTGFIDPTWVQDFGRVQVTPVNSGDDPLIPYTSVKLGKVTMPTIVSLPNDKGVYRVSSSSKQTRYFWIDADRFFSLVEGSVTSKFEYYFKIQNAFYVSPCDEELNFIGILDNPMDGYVLLTEKVLQDSLSIGTSYTVYGTQIIHDSVPYNPTSTFVATKKTYSGNGYVMHTTQKRRMTDRDPFPMSQTLSEFVIMKIFTEDFQFSKQTIADITNDAQDQLSLTQNGKGKTQESA